MDATRQLVGKLVGVNDDRGACHPFACSRYGSLATAIADDGLIEAFRVTDARRFAVAVQWHPEWQAEGNAFSVALFKAFGAAARDRATQDTNR